MGRIIFISLLPFFILASCNSNADKRVDGLIAQEKKIDSVQNRLQGDWHGYYEAVDPVYDTIFYESLHHKLAYMLNDSVADSSLVKEIILTDTFKTQPIRMSFTTTDSATWSGIAEIGFEADTVSRTLPTTLNMDANLNTTFLHLAFGKIANPVNASADNPFEVIDMPDKYLNLQEALSSDSFTLVVKKISQDSLELALPEGYGKIVLWKRKGKTE